MIDKKKHLSKAEWLNMLSKFPELGILEKQLFDFFYLDKSALSHQELSKLFLDIAIALPFHAIEYSVKNINQIPIYRARKNVDANIEDIEDVRTFSYPKVKYCNENGRANIKDTSVFYGAHNGATAILETKPKIGDVIFVGKWTIAAKRNAMGMFYMPYNLNDKNPLAGFNRNNHDLLSNLFLEDAAQWATHLQMIARFVADAFVRELPPYTFTSYLAHETLFVQKGIDMIFYPSVARQGVSSNIVMHTDFVDQFIVLEKVNLIRVNNINGNELNYSLEYVASFVDEKLQWRKPTDDDYSSLFGKSDIRS